MARKVEPYDGAVVWIPALTLSRFHMLICSSSHMGEPGGKKVRCGWAEAEGTRNEQGLCST
jgi:hypothetical protein